MINSQKREKNEEHVVDLVENYFISKGYTVELRGRIGVAEPDLVVRNKQDNSVWVIEAKGNTKSPGTDFQTGLGQLIQRMDEERHENIKYAIALPKTEYYRNQYLNVPSWIWELLGIYLILVDDENQVRVINPEDIIA